MGSVMILSLGEKGWIFVFLRVITSIYKAYQMGG